MAEEAHQGLEPAQPALGSAGPASKPAAETATASQPAAAAPASAATTAAAAPTEPKGYWPDNWLERVSKGDEKRAKQLGQYQSPEALADALVNLRRRMDSGEFKPTLAKDAKPEEVNAWRKTMGIPEKADGYDLKEIKVPEEVGELPKETIAAFLQTAHNANYTPDQTRVALQSYYNLLKQDVVAQAEQDEKDRGAVIDELGAEWGGKFSQYKTRIENIISMFPESVRDVLRNARAPDGRALFNHPDVMRGFVALSLRDIPEGVVVPAGGADLGKSMTDRYLEINKMMRTDRKAYDRNTSVQKEYASLLETMQRQGLVDKNGNLVERKAA